MVYTVDSMRYHVAHTQARAVSFATEATAANICRWSTEAGLLHLKQGYLYPKVKNAMLQDPCTIRFLHAFPKLHVDLTCSKDGECLQTLLFRHSHVVENNCVQKLRSLKKNES